MSASPSLKLTPVHDTARPQPEVTTDLPGNTMKTLGDTLETLGGQDDVDHFSLKVEPTTSRHTWPNIPGYEIIGVLGRGGMGVVYRARQQGLNRVVALKMVQSGDDDPIHRARFKLEAEAVAQLQHPSIIQIYEIGEWQAQHYFSMEFVQGESYSQHLAGKPQPPTEAAKLVETVARGVHAAHQRNIIHRDLKPANILLNQAGEPKVADFGLAKNVSEASGQTQSGSILGTPSYMAPEQAAGKNDELTPAVDVYSLGAILYEALTGRAPFRGISVWDTIHQVLHQEPVPPRTLIPTIPLDVETICLKCLQKEPGNRYSSADALADDLKRYLAHEPIKARTIRWHERLLRWRRRNPALAAALLFTTFILITATITSTWLAIVAMRSAADARKNMKLYDERTQLAMETLESVIFKIQTKLAGLPHTQKVRAELLETALSGLKAISDKLSEQKRVDRNTAHAMLQLAEAFRQLGKDAGTEIKVDPTQLYEQSIATFKTLHAEASNLESKTDLAQACQLFSIHLQNLDDSAWDLTPDLAQKQQQRPLIQQSEKFIREAISLRREAQALQREGESTYRLADALCEAGHLFTRINKGDEAKATLEEACALLKPMRSSDEPGLRSKKLYGRCAERLGDYYFDVKENFAEAKLHYEEALAAFQKLAQQRPISDVEMQMNLANAYWRVGDALAEMKQVPEALVYCEKELAITQKLEPLAENNTKLLYDCSISYDHVSKMLLKLNRFADALVPLKATMRLKLRGIELDPDHHRLHTSLVRPIIRMGDAYLALGQPEQARKEYLDGLKVLEMYQAKHQDKEIGEHIASVRESLGKLGTSDSKR